MRIYSMTATFGKLEHETITLEPGLNVISGGNEWGKSTWCAFLCAMLYGVDTRAKSTKTALADKERYAPWSGSPMSGRIDLCWQGRDITIERKTTGRTPMGAFRAYETASGIAVQELDGRNCGEKLLGVERSVFQRTGFIRFADLTVTDDEALRRRLNSLVTTGDENSAADRLAGELKALKNRIRHNQTGLLPQAERQRREMEEKRTALQRLTQQNDEVLQKLDSNEARRLSLENHMDALIYEASLEDARQVSRAEAALEAAQAEFEQKKTLCDSLPSREDALERLEEIHRLQDQLMDLQRRLQELPRMEEAPEPPAQFAGLSGEEALNRVREDGLRHDRLGKGRSIPLILGAILMAAGILTWFFRQIPGLVCFGCGFAIALWGAIRLLRRNRQRRELEQFYGSDDPARWRVRVEAYAEQCRQYTAASAAAQRQRESLERALGEVREQVLALDQRADSRSREDWESVLEAWDAREDALRTAQKAQEHFNTLKSMARQAQLPEFPDTLDYSESYTNLLLESCAAERARLENLRGQYRGSMEAIGSKAELDRQLEKADAGISRLEKHYAAVLLAQELLQEARQELQRRFAPRIARRAGELMSQMTGGRSDRLSLGEDLTLRAGADREDTLRETLWRSDGTVDQLYLSLRLAVAGELLPGCPLVLDDALVRFDDSRLKAAMEILRQEGEQRQVILFTCHSRELNV